MLFNSLTFLIFGVLFFAAWPLAKGPRAVRWGFITVASFIFYGWWDWRFIFLILASGLLDYFCALGMERRPAWKRPLLVVSVIGNIGSLAAFKYITFLTVNANALLQAAGGWQVPVIEAALPIGISFYTFQSMSYTIDVYRGKLTPTRNVLHFFAYLSMFPQLVAGPIIRASHLLPQLEEERKTTEEDRWQGLKLIAYGYFKKVVLADNLAPAVNLAFGSNLVEPSAPFWWLVVSMFALQIYFDFSGYSDIARGLGRWMGYDFPLNFDHPYKSISMREFWNRWHISLSTWFRDYVYIPMGGSRVGGLAFYRNIWITMILSGLWHGAAWHFVIWGGLHAFYVSLEKLTSWPQRLHRVPGGKLLSWLLVILMVWIGWVFFRAQTFEQAWEILVVMFNPTLLTFPDLPLLFAVAAGALALGAANEVIHRFSLERLYKPNKFSVRVLEPVYIALVLVACIYLRGPGSAFIYFQF
jgi:alginate O-acetyltransferase complex protein AlgI